MIQFLYIKLNLYRISHIFYNSLNKVTPQRFKILLKIGVKIVIDQFKLDIEDGINILEIRIDICCLY